MATAPPLSPAGTLSGLITTDGPLFVFPWPCLSDPLSCPAASSVHAGSVLIRSEMAPVIMSTLVTRDDNAQYYFYAMFCVGRLFPILIKWGGGGTGPSPPMEPMSELLMFSRTKKAF